MSERFYFKQFSVADNKSTMKVGTDAVLLGVYANSENPTSVLDIGTGSGVIALMLAQRYPCPIHAIDIDKNSCRQAEDNFSQSQWAERMNVINLPLQTYVETQQSSYDLIVCNPPFFSAGIKPEIHHKRISRHDEQLSLKELLRCCSLILSPTGKVSIIFPSLRLKELSLFAAQYNLSIETVLIVYPKINQPANRHVVQLTKRKTTHTIISTLAIRNPQNSYTQEFKNFVAEYYLDFPY